MQIGLKPDEVLDMSLDTFRACSNGYLDHLLDLQFIGLQQGYWAGYYTRAKKPKPLKVIVDKMIRGAKRRRDNSLPTVKSEVDVSGFQELEAQFQKRLNNIKNN